MRLSQAFGKTLRQAPADAEMISHQLLIRANFVRPLGAGIYTYMPFGFRVLTKIHRIMSEEMDTIGGQEMLMPNLHPAQIWQTTGRWDEWAGVMMRVEAGGSREYAISPTHEEVVVDLTGKEINSYRDMPQVIYHISKKFRDEVRPRGGMIRLREFIMKDAYSMNLEEAGLDEFYPSMVQAYINIFNRVGLDNIVQVNADVGAMGGKSSHEFLYPHEQGEDSFIECDNCGYSANVEAAVFDRIGEAPETNGDLVKLETPDCKTIADVAAFCDVPTSQTLKAVFFWAIPTGKEEKEGFFLFVVIRGDLDVNEVKLTNALGGVSLRAATEKEIKAIGAQPGYASPIGLNVAKSLEEKESGVVVVADTSMHNGGNYVFGANEAGYHYTGANYPRDFAVTLIADIAEADTGYRCGVCHTGTLHARRAIEAGHCFKLGQRYSLPTNTTALGPDGKPRHVYMGSYGIGLDRLMGIVVEKHNDENGIIWPRSIAPYDIHLMHVGKGDEIKEMTDRLYKELIKSGFEVLYDDRNQNPGVKFKDADLIGIPLRVSIGKRSLENGGYEVKRRAEQERQMVPVAEILSYIQNLDF